MSGYGALLGFTGSGGFSTGTGVSAFTGSGAFSTGVSAPAGSLFLAAGIFGFPFAALALEDTAAGIFWGSTALLAATSKRCPWGTTGLCTPASAASLWQTTKALHLHSLGELELLSYSWL